MPTAHARQICPKAVFLSPNFSLYHSFHDRLIEIFESITPLIEPVALDEAFLDVSGAHGVWGSSREIALSLRRRVKDELGLSCSVGVGRTKLVAKLASKAAKPLPSVDGPHSGTGVLVIETKDELSFIRGHLVRALPGVGPRTEERLGRLGITRVVDLAQIPRSTLVAHFGRAQGHLLCELASGLDERPVVVERAARSIGHEETFDADEFDSGALLSRAKAMAVSVATRCREARCVGRTVAIKVRYGDFSNVTRSKTTGAPITMAAEIADIAGVLLEEIDADRGVRLLGVSLSGLLPTEEAPAHQLLLFGSEESSVRGSRSTEVKSREELEETADEIRRRFGKHAIGSLANITRDAARAKTEGTLARVDKEP
jgi:DNA polymerase-4